MDYESYKKAFWQMQKNYLLMNDLITKLRAEKAQEYLSENGEKTQCEDYAKQYQELKNKVYANAISLKEYFVENNEEFDYIDFGTSLSFFNGYSIIENEYLLKKSDYQKLNAMFLKHYKDELNRILVSKKEQYQMLDNGMKTNAKEYLEEYKEPIQISNNSTARAKALRARFEKDLIQRENVHKKVHFIEKEAQIIDEVLNEPQEVTR